MNKTLAITFGLILVSGLAYAGVRAMRKKAEVKPKKKLKPVIEVKPLEKITEEEYERGLLNPFTRKISVADLTIVKSPASSLGAKKIKLT